MKKAITAAFVAALITGTAQASDWVSVGKSDDGKQEIFVDVSSIRIAGDTRRAWIKTVFAPHTRKGIAGDANKWVSYGVVRVAFNCGEETSQDEAATYYYDDGTNYPLDAAFAPPREPVAPDTMSDFEIQFSSSARGARNRPLDTNSVGRPRTTSRGTRVCIHYEDSQSDYY
jgi:hypothetical protein